MNHPKQVERTINLPRIVMSGIAEHIRDAWGVETSIDDRMIDENTNTTLILISDGQSSLSVAVTVTVAPQMVVGRVSATYRHGIGGDKETHYTAASTRINGTHIHPGALNETISVIATWLRSNADERAQMLGADIGS